MKLNNYQSHSKQFETDNDDNNNNENYDYELIIDNFNTTDASNENNTSKKDNNINNKLLSSSLATTTKMLKIGMRQSPINIEHNDLTINDLCSINNPSNKLIIDYSKLMMITSENNVNIDNNSDLINLIDQDEHQHHKQLTKKMALASFTLENTGNGWKLNIPDQVSQRCPISGGPLPGIDEYRLLQIHCHWASDSTRGSEHTINGQPFAGEIHLVHWNSSKYDNPNEAMQSIADGDGLAVIGVFVQQQQDTNRSTSKSIKPEPFNIILNNLNQIRFKGDHIQLPAGDLDLNQLIASGNYRIEHSSSIEKKEAESNHKRTGIGYWTYQGSLTTPPFYESVIWIVMERPIMVQESQVLIIIIFLLKIYLYYFLIHKPTNQPTNQFAILSGYLEFSWQNFVR